MRTNIAARFHVDTSQFVLCINTSLLLYYYSECHDCHPKLCSKIITSIAQKQKRQEKETAGKKQKYGYCIIAFTRKHYQSNMLNMSISSATRIVLYPDPRTPPRSDGWSISMRLSVREPNAAIACSCTARFSMKQRFFRAVVSGSTHDCRTDRVWLHRW